MTLPFNIYKVHNQDHRIPGLKGRIQSAAIAPNDSGDIYQHHLEGLYQISRKTMCTDFMQRINLQAKPVNLSPKSNILSILYRLFKCPPKFNFSRPRSHIEFVGLLNTYRRYYDNLGLNTCMIIPMRVLREIRNILVTCEPETRNSNLFKIGHIGLKENPIEVFLTLQDSDKIFLGPLKPNTDLSPIIYLNENIKTEKFSDDEVSIRHQVRYDFDLSHTEYKYIQYTHISKPLLNCIINKIKRMIWN